MADYFLGIDLGGTNLALGLTDKKGRLVACETALSNIQAGPEYAVELAVKLYRKLIDQADISTSEVRAVGIACPGPISAEEGKIVEAPNLPAFAGFALRADLTGAVGLPGVLDNDANAACWGEYVAGAGQGCNDMVLFTMGTGIGSGVVCRGELMTGDGGNGAELGHVVVYPGGRECSCGQQGCLEAYASAWAIEQAFGSTANCKEIFGLAETGNNKATQVVGTGCRAMAIAIVNLRHILTPQKIILAGGITNAGKVLIDNIQKYYNQFVWSLKPEPLEICLGQLKDKAGVIGAACRAQYHYQQHSLYKQGV